MAGITTHLSILMSMDSTPPSKDTVWIKKEDLTICCLQETHLIDRNKHWLRGKG
jgi:hypothetical protein